MTCHTYRITLLITLLALARTSFGQDELLPSPLNGPEMGEVATDPNAEGVEYLTRGPVHEAFVTQVTSDPGSTPVIPNAPPEPVNEIPPDFQPEGDNVVWIPGYWAWDEDRGDFLWVSGVWRVAPENRRWVPGYWTSVLDSNEVVIGYQWVPGFWADAQVETLEYLDDPPTSLEQGPSQPAISENHFWVPGCWVHTSYRYAWQPGYWHAYEPDRIWIPAHYVWTPHGCIYVSGYWDYRIPERGNLFTPVYIDRQLVARPGFSYRPWYVVNTPSLFMHLFVCPTRQHYFFGDYYGPNYARSYYSYASYHRLGYGYDPLYVYYSHHFGRQGINYGSRLASWNLYFNINLNSRPRRTLASHHRYTAGLGHRPAEHTVLAHSLWDEVSRSRHHGRKHQLVRAEASRHRDALIAADQLRSFRHDRHDLEESTRRHRGKTASGQRAALRLPKPTTVASTGSNTHRQGRGPSTAPTRDRRDGIDGKRANHDGRLDRATQPSRDRTTSTLSGKPADRRDTSRPPRDADKVVVRSSNDKRSTRDRENTHQRSENLRNDFRRNFSTGSQRDVTANESVRRLHQNNKPTRTQPSFTTPNAKVTGSKGKPVSPLRRSATFGDASNARGPVNNRATNNASKPRVVTRAKPAAPTEATPPRTNRRAPRFSEPLKAKPTTRNRPTRTTTTRPPQAPPKPVTRPQRSNSSAANLNGINRPTTPRPTYKSSAPVQRSTRSTANLNGTNRPTTPRPTYKSRSPVQRSTRSTQSRTKASKQIAPKPAAARPPRSTYNSRSPVQRSTRSTPSRAKASRPSVPKPTATRSSRPTYSSKSRVQRSTRSRAKASRPAPRKAPPQRAPSKSSNSKKKR